MAKIYRITDRIPVKVDDITVTLSPLTLAQKSEALRLIAEGTVDKKSLMVQDGVLLLLKYSVKKIEGLKAADDSNYELTFTEDGKSLSDDCVEDLLNIELHKKLLMVCSSLTRGIPTEFCDQDGKPIEGVEILPIEQKEAATPN